MTQLNEEINTIDNMTALSVAALNEARAERDKKYPIYAQYKQLKSQQSALLTEQFKLESALEQLSKQEKNESLYKGITPEKYTAVVAKVEQAQAQLDALKKNDKEMDKLRLQLKNDIKVLVDRDETAKKLSRDIRHQKKQTRELQQLRQFLSNDKETDVAVGKIYKAADSKKFLLTTYSRLGFIPKASGHLYSATSLPGPVNGIEATVNHGLNYFGWLPPLRVALVGTLGLFDLYRLMQSKESARMKGSRTFIALSALALGIAALLVPAATAVIFAATVIGLGAAREGLNYYAAAVQVKKIEQEVNQKKAQLAQLIQTSQDNNDPKISYTQRIAYLQTDIKRNEIALRQAKDSRDEKRANFVLGVLSVVSVVLMIFPPTAVVGAALFFGTIAVAVGKRTGLAGKLWNGLKKWVGKNEKPADDSVENEKPVLQDTPTPKSHLGEIRSEAVIFTKLDQHQHPDQSEHDIRQHSVAVIQETIETLHHMQEKPVLVATETKKIEQKIETDVKNDKDDEDKDRSHPTEHM